MANTTRPTEASQGRIRRAIWRLSLVAIAACAGHASATIIDFEALARGALTTNQLQAAGVLVSGVDVSACCEPGKVLDVVLGDLSVFDFGGSLRQALVYGIVGDQLNFDFVTPGGAAAVTDAVSLRVGDGDAASESFRVSFFDAAHNLLNAQEFTTTSGPIDGGVTVSFAGAGIHRVEILGIGSGSGGAVDDLTFNDPTAITVAEPPALAMTALALLAAYGIRTRRR
jgi:hypothetical protein